MITLLLYLSLSLYKETIMNAISTTAEKFGINLEEIVSEIDRQNQARKDKENEQKKYNELKIAEYIDILESSIQKVVDQPRSNPLRSESDYGEFNCDIDTKNIHITIKDPTVVKTMHNLIDGGSYLDDDPPIISGFKKYLDSTYENYIVNCIQVQVQFSLER